VSYADGKLSMEELTHIALHDDARIALLMSDPQPRVPKILRLRGAFLTGGAGSFIDLSLERYVVGECIVISTDLIIRSDTFQGNVFTPQSAYYRTKGDTWVDVDVRREGTDPMTFIDKPTALEHVFGPDCAWAGPRLLTQGQDIIVRCYLRRALAVSELPYEITIDLKCLQIGGCLWRQVTFQRAVDELIERGIDPWGYGRPGSRGRPGGDGGGGGGEGGGGGGEGGAHSRPSVGGTPAVPARPREGAGGSSAHVFGRGSEMGGTRR